QREDAVEGIRKAEVDGNVESRDAVEFGGGELRDAIDHALRGPLRYGADDVEALALFRAESHRRLPNAPRRPVPQAPQPPVRAFRLARACRFVPARWLCVLACVFNSAPQPPLRGTFSPRAGRRE